ncbi:MAG TPA: hypothetical protein DCL76_06295, partial [Chloroflexi bacterium]|nr:hypothetical protein [Chloroflexota bacterium]
KTDGKIGIGTTSPNHLLHVEGALSGTTGFNLTNTHASGYGLYVKGGGTGNYAFRVDNQAGTEALRIVDGKLGIGTTSPTELLDVEGTIECLNELRSKTGNDLKLNAGSANRDVFLQVNDSTIMTVRGSTGNVGIGTTNPQSLIHTSSGSSSGGLFMESNGCNAYIWAIQNTGNLINGSTAGRMGLRSANGFDFSGNDGTSIHLDIDSSGNATFKGDITVSDANPIINFTDTNNDSDFRIQVEAGTFHIEDTTNAGADRLTINSLGDIEVGGNLKTNNLLGRNLIINGAFTIAQRGTSSTSDGIHTVDRFEMGYGGENEAPTQSQHALTSSDTGPWAKGFRYSYHIQNGNQTSGAGAADYIRIITRLEAQDLANSGWHYTSSNSYATLSFWVRSSVAQTFYGQVFSQDGSPQNFPFSTGALSANTWTKVEIKIPGGTNVQFDNNNKQGMVIYWWPFGGTNYTGSPSLNTWASFSSGNRIPDMTSTWWTTNDATFELTGVQLEVGSIATEFDHRSYGEELARCQRYYQTVPDSVLSSGYGSANGYSRGSHIFVQTMRSNPTVTITETSTGNLLAQGSSKDGFYATFDGLSGTGASLFNFIATAEL